MSDAYGNLQDESERREIRSCGGSYTLTQPNQKGLKFVQVLLPPVQLRDVGIVGADNGIYRASIPLRREDQLPEGVNLEDVNEEELFEKVRDMEFPPVVHRRDPVPRFAGGSYTKIDKKKPKLKFAPIRFISEEPSTEVALIGADGGIYKGIERGTRKSILLEKKLRGTSRPIRIKMDPGSGKDILKPSVVTLHVNEKPAVGLGLPVRSPIVQVPIEELHYLFEIAAKQNKTADEH